MNNYKNNRKNRFKINGERNFRKRLTNGHKNQNDFNANVDFKRKSPGRFNQNAGRLVEKYTDLAREALSNGDKILSENYMQHADHFSRVQSLQEALKIQSNNNSRDTEIKSENLEN